MPKKIIYPTKESIIFVNELVNLMSNRKADQHKLLRSDAFITHIIEKTKKAKRDTYYKAAILLSGLIAAHGFASGNKRTAFIIATDLILENKEKSHIKNFNKVERIIRNIGRFSIGEIALWLKKGEIDEKKIF